MKKVIMASPAGFNAEYAFPDLRNKSKYNHLTYT
jgi:hypothetical protein